MEYQGDIVKAIERFSAWSSPWEFPHIVSADLAPSDLARGHFDKIWRAACDPKIWLSTDNLAAGVATTEAALAKSLPWLSALACQQLARGASYQWR